MKMRCTRVFLIQLLLCLLLLSISSGAPPKQEDGQPSRTFSAARYSDEESDFIMNEMLNLPSDFTLVSDMTVWKSIAKKMKELHTTNPRGFPHERNPKSICNHFRYTLMKNKKGSEKLPETFRQQLLRDFKANKHFGGKRPYTYEEDKLIVDQLLNIPEAEVPRTNYRIWTNIARQFRRKRGSPGFNEDRTPGGIRNHFLRKLSKDPSGRVTVPATLIEKFGYGGGASKSEPSSQNQQTDLQVANEEQDEEDLMMEETENYWASLIEELEKSTPCELDFSQLDRSPVD